MAHPFDLDQLIASIKAAATGVLNEDVSQIAGFSETQVNMMAKQAAWIAEATAKGELDDDLRAFFLKNLADMAKNFVQVLQGLAAITIEKVWNAIVGVLWDAVRGAIGGIALPIPKF